MNAIVRAPFVSSTREASGSLVRAFPLSLRRALVPFLVSRMLIVLLFAGIPLLEAGLAAHWGASDTMSLRLSPGAVADGFARVAIGNDSTFYYEIASKGYEHRPFDTSKAANWAFFPLHPLLWRAAAAVTGEWIWSGVLVANVLALAALCLLWELARRLTDSERIADNTVLFASFWPSAYFLMLPHTEALFLLLVTASLLASLSRRPWVASIIGGFAGAARANGIFLAPAMLVGRWLRGERRVADLANLLPMGAGLAIFMAYLWAITGNPLAFKDIPAIGLPSFVDAGLAVAPFHASVSAPPVIAPSVRIVREGAGKHVAHTRGSMVRKRRTTASPSADIAVLSVLVEHIDAQRRNAARRAKKD